MSQCPNCPIFSSLLQFSAILTSSLDGISELLELLCGDGVEDGVDHGDILGGSDGAELEAGSSVWEGGSTVAVLGGDVERPDRGGSEVKSLDSRVVL